MKKLLLEMAEDPKVLEDVSKEIESFLIDLRDSRISTISASAGFCIRESDGSPSDIIRLPISAGIKMAIKKIADLVPTERANDDTL